MTLYNYQGPVWKFDQLVETDWMGETVAPSRNKALSNLTYQYKKAVDLIPSTKIKLDDKYLREV